nr:cache domain-containing protein [Clostridia bacterium]
MSVRYRWGSHIRSYRWRSIFLKYFAMLFLSLFILIVAVNVIYYVLYNGVLREEAFAANENALEKAATFMDGALRNAENLSANLIIDYEAEFFLNEKIGSLSREYQNQNYLIKKMSGMVTAGEYYESIFLYSESRDEILDTAYGLSGRRDFYDAQWYDHYLKRPYMPWAFSRVMEIKPLKIAQRLVSYIIPFNISTTQRRGAVVVNFNIDRIKRMIDRSAEPMGNLFILDPEGAVLYDTRLVHLGAQAEAVEALGVYLQTQVAWPNSFRFADADGRDMVCSCYVSEKNGWRYISMVPFDLLGKMAQQFQMVVFLTLLGGCLTAALIAFFMAVRVYAPIKTIIDILD